MTLTDPTPASLRDEVACTLYEHDSAEIAGAPPWIGNRLDQEHSGLRERYLGRADALLDGPLAALLAKVARQAEERRLVEEELNVLRRQRMGPERERELLEANNRILDRARAAETAQAASEASLATVQRERRAGAAFRQRDGVGVSVRNGIPGPSSRDRPAGTGRDSSPRQPGSDAPQDETGSWTHNSENAADDVRGSDRNAIARNRWMRIEYFRIKIY